jgi:outer membrane protein assembly factor BamB
MNQFLMSTNPNRKFPETLVSNHVHMRLRSWDVSFLERTFPAGGEHTMIGKWLRVMSCVCLGMVTVGWPRAAAAQEPLPSLCRSASPDWPQWRGPHRDGISAETGLLQSWPAEGPKLLWKVSGIGHGYSSPIIVANGVYITGDAEQELVISAFTLDGQPRWKTTNGEPWKTPFPGTRSSCTFDDGKIYHMNAHGNLVCLDAVTGKPAWAVNLLARYEAQNIMWGISESVLVHGDRVFATPAGAKGLMVALDKRTGAPVWATPALDGEKASYASPILIQAGQRKLLVNSCAKYAFAVDSETGGLVWKLPQVDPKNSVATTPVLSGRLLMITNASREYGALFGVQLGDGAASQLWTRELKITHGGTVCVDGRLYGSSSRGDMPGWVKIDVETGKPTLVKPAGELSDGSMIVADGRFYCLTVQGLMTLQESTASGFRTTGTFRLTEKPVKDAWAHPLLCQGRLFLRYQDVLYCYDVRR